MENKDEITSANLKYLLPLIYILPTYALYFFEIYIMFIKKDSRHKFDASFYKIFGYSAVVYFLCSFSYYFNMRMIKTPFFIAFVKSWGTSGIFLTFLVAFCWYISYPMYLTTVLLSFNRFTVFILKHKYEKFWKRYLFTFLSLCTLVPLLGVWHIPFCDYYMILEDPKNPDGPRYSTPRLDPFPWMNSSRNAVILIASTSFLSFVFNFYVIVKLLQQRFGKDTQFKASPQDIKMVIYTLLIFMVEIVNCIQQFMFLTITDQTVLTAMFNANHYVVDFGTLTPAWFILLTNKSLQKQILKIVFHKKFLPTTFSITGVNNSKSPRTVRITAASSLTR